MADSEGVAAIVIDNGTKYTKAGLADSETIHTLVIVGMATTRIHSISMLRIPWHDARYRMFAHIEMAGQNAAEDSISEETIKHLAQSQQDPALFEQPRSYELFLECIGDQMGIETRNEAERAQFARQVLGVEISPTSLAGAANIGELAQMALAELHQGVKDS